jgi:hypothetical protein
MMNKEQTFTGSGTTTTTTTITTTILFCGSLCQVL